MIKERLHSLRELMKKNNVDAYLILTDDFHGSDTIPYRLSRFPASG